MTNDVFFDSTTDVADEADMAFIFEQTQLARQLTAIQKSVNSKAESLSECTECGADIPEARQKAVKGCQLCIDCQTFFERSNNMKGFYHG